MYRLLPILLLIPMPVCAAQSFSDLVFKIIDLIGSATTVLVGAAMLLFFVNAARSLWGAKGGDTGEQQKLYDVLLWGVIIIFVMASVWGIIAILKQTLLSSGV